MLIQILSGAKGEALVPADILLAREGAMIQASAEALKAAVASGMQVELAKPSENMTARAAVIMSRAAASMEKGSGPLEAACADKAVLDAVCSLEYSDASGKPVACVPYGTAARKPAPKRAPQKPKASKPSGSKPVPDAGGPGKPGRDPMDASKAIMAKLRAQGLPDGCLPAMLEAVREAKPDGSDLESVVVGKLSHGRSWDVPPTAVFMKLEPVFPEIRAILDEVDGKI